MNTHNPNNTCLVQVSYHFNEGMDDFSLPLCSFPPYQEVNPYVP
jgi:hypothetical protein